MYIDSECRRETRNSGIAHRRLHFLLSIRNVSGHDLRLFRAKSVSDRFSEEFSGSIPVVGLPWVGFGLPEDYFTLFGSSDASTEAQNGPKPTDIRPQKLNVEQSSVPARYLLIYWLP